MFESKIKVVVKKPNELGEIKVISNKLETFKDLVNGYLECLRLNNGIVIILNEEGKLLDLEPNLFYNNDILVGNLIFCESDLEGNFTSLSENSIEYLKELTLI